MADRKLFEDVGSATRAAPVATGTLERAPSRGLLRGWLILLFALVVLMVAVGGLTRLTDSGLSITEWRPVTGAVPPLNQAAWLAEFEKYRAIPEYQLQNKGMSLEEFKVIYWWEWGHRQLGRVIGLVWAVGFLFLLATRRIPVGWTPRLLGLGVLGGLQGAIGWWMVSSGLTGRMVDVASYRLATHLGLAFLILGLIAWMVFQLGRKRSALLQARRSGEAGLARLTAGLLALAAVQILLGALVAGIDAGRGFTDWPLMAGAWIPPNALVFEPAWTNFFENPGLVQFNHRVAGYLLLAAGLVVWHRSRRSPNAATRLAFNLAAAMLLLQAVIGVMTVLYAAPVGWALLHQLGAVVLVVLLLRARFLALYPLAQSLRGT